ncbi:iron transport system membrane protein SitD (plasmid) [Pantoea agglomerans]|nr:iron transport system membrane protein SitD [Pantoea agglomerans]
MACAIAVLLTRRFSHALLVSVLVSLSGVYLSFFIDSAPAPTIVLLFALVFIVAMVISGRKTRQLERQRLNAS